MKAAICPHPLHIIAKPPAKSSDPPAAPGAFSIARIGSTKKNMGAEIADRTNVQMKAIRSARTRALRRGMGGGPEYESRSFAGGVVIKHPFPKENAKCGPAYGNSL